MATQRIAVPASPLQFPSQPHPNPEVITQNELALFLSLRGRLHQLAAQVESTELSVRTRLERGIAVEEGDHVAELKEQFRASIAWKEKAIEFAELLGLNGQQWAHQVLAHTAKARTVSLFHQVNPKRAGGMACPRVQPHICASPRLPMRTAMRPGGTMNSKQTVVATLKITRRIAFRLLDAGEYKRASDMAHDALLQVPARVRTADTEALHVIAATAYYAAKA